MDRQTGSVGPAQHQFARARFTAGKSGATMPVKAILRIMLDEPGKRLGHQLIADHTEHLCCGKIGLQHGSLEIDGQIAHRGEIVKVAEAIT